MSAGKMKNLVLVALVLINVFLLAFYSAGRAGELTLRRQKIEDICDIMENYGIALRPSAIGPDTRLSGAVTSRDAGEEDAIVAAVLGNAEKTTSGNLSRYVSGAGEASFNARGEFVIDVRPGAIPAPEAAASARRLLRDMGIPTDEPAATIEGDGVEVFATCTYASAPVFNCQIRFTYQSGSLVRVSGRRADPARTASGEEITGAAEALLDFLSYIDGEEQQCGEITYVQAGYRFNVGAIGDGELSPGWRIISDRDEYFVYSSTGAVERNIL
jgi:hypothetical protein